MKGHHLVWIPKYRKRILTGVLAERIKELVEECASVNGWKIEEVNVQKDHVHMLVRLRPNVSVSTAVLLFKGKSSYEIRKEFPKLKEFAWGTSKIF